jgi:putative inorganic carbon (HCO3(-)) transporter
LNAPETTSVALPTSRPWFLPGRGVAWWALAALVAVLTARLTMESIQLGCTIALLVLTVGAYVRNRTAALAIVWVVWLIAPFLRRVFLLSEAVQRAEPLAVAPFLLTAAVIVLELTQVELRPRTRRLLLLVAGGYLVGLPIGLLHGPQAAMFAAFAYITAVGCFVIGYREAAERRLVLPTVLMVALPVLSLYAIYQYYAHPLPIWDFLWQRGADINTVGSPEHGRIRVWSTLNSPGTFGLVLGVAAITLVAWKRLNAAKVAGAVAVFAALALTYVRSAWIAIAFALLALAFVTRGAAIKRIAPLVIVLAVVGQLAVGGSTGAALSERFSSLGSLNSDESAQARSATPLALVPRAIAAPLGNGLGSAGEATRLNESGAGLRSTDNGYLSLLLQVGPVGWVVVMSGVLTGLVSSWRNAWRRTDTTDVLAFGVLAYFALDLLAGDNLYGIGGMIFWYMCGIAARRREMRELAEL